jgi:hypothetical protein
MGESPPFLKGDEGGFLSSGKKENLFDFERAIRLYDSISNEIPVEQG